jgi:hypothetical protein
VLREADGKTRAIEVAGYFEATDRRVDRWWFEATSREERERVPPFLTPRFHRTLSSWVAIVRAAEFVIEAFGEPRASEELAAAEPVVEDTTVAPLFLHLRVTRR